MDTLVGYKFIREKVFFFGWKTNVLRFRCTLRKIEFRAINPWKKGVGGRRSLSFFAGSGAGESQSDLLQIENSPTTIKMIVRFWCQPNNNLTILLKWSLLSPVYRGTGIHMNHFIHQFNEKLPSLPPCKVPKVEGALHSNANLRCQILNDPCMTDMGYHWQQKNTHILEKSIQKVMSKSMLFWARYTLKHVSVGNDTKVHAKVHQKIPGRSMGLKFIFPNISIFCLQIYQVSIIVSVGGI